MAQTVTFYLSNKEELEVCLNIRTKTNSIGKILKASLLGRERSWYYRNLGMTEKKLKEVKP